jgi:hypothetical protein
VKLEKMFRRVHPNSANLFHGRSPLSEICNDLILAQSMPSGAVHTNNEMKIAPRSARAAILTALERQLKKGDKSLVGNKGYRRFLATPDDDHFAVDRAKAEEDAKFDGIFVLRTNADLTPLEAMLCYKGLWMVERAFRTSKSLFAVRRRRAELLIVALIRHFSYKPARTTVSQP